ncbi:MAG: helix-turn-helix domain-containing protein [Paracoccus sp. (in: a-proteobacteria)]|nr:helix-turn-helix domain-containing protein [Paracoccus sp. (in: a-proteobacteria)]
MKKHSSLRQTIAGLAALPPITQAILARHWRVDPDTARRVLRETRLPQVPGPYRTARYGWPDVWRLEGAPHAQITDPARHAELMEPLLTAEDLAKSYGCTATTIRNWARARILPAIRIGGSHRFRASAIEWSPMAPFEAPTAGSRTFGRSPKM